MDAEAGENEEGISEDAFQSSPHDGSFHGFLKGKRRRDTGSARVSVFGKSDAARA